MQIPNHSHPTNRRTLLRWLIAGICITLLLSISDTWQSWQHNVGLSTLTSLPIYFLAIWVNYLLWVPIALLIYYLHQKIPMFSPKNSFWWLKHLVLSLSIGCIHLIIDTSLIWLSMSSSFLFWLSYTEKLVRWLPYELLAYWACLSVMTLISHRKQLFTPDSINNQYNSHYLQRLSLKIKDEVHIIPVAQIDYIEACDNYVQIWQGKNYQLTKETMNNLEQQLDPRQFMRIHRSFIVNLNAVQCINKNANHQSTIMMREGKRLPISRRRKASLNQRLK